MSGASNHRPDLRAVIFDMDGLLVDTEPLSYRAWIAHLARDYGVTLTEEDHAAMVGMSSLDSWTIARDRLGLALDLPAGLPALRAARDPIYRALLEEGVTPMPGAVELARACHDAGLLVLTCGTYGNVLRFLPPLVIGDDDLRRGLEILDGALLLP